MGKASRRKKLNRQHGLDLEQGSDVNLSDALIKISDPYAYGGISLDDYRKLIIMAIVAWNISNMPEEQRIEQALSFVTSILSEKGIMDGEISAALHDQEPSQGIFVLTLMLEKLMERKLELFPHDVRRITSDFTLTEDSSGRRLTVSYYRPDISQALH